ncbi:MAG: DUF455 domain-containing protein [Epsilonproteobacteria bacterium]|nr:DUF455 domain-containing protein [Campylobacterota bacterium]NPA63464.1 ferritin-like domain-containing protein [Campylobacterota bacterium]
MEFFRSLETIIQIANPYEKIAKFRHFYQEYLHDRLIYDHQHVPKIFQDPSYVSFCSIVDPREVPRRQRLGTREGRAVLLHAVAHIEYSAIDLALDAAYRYKGMPRSFYDDWLEVADDECRHFLMIDDLLKTLGYRYGHFPVHRGLFEAAKASLELIDRMAVVPRYLEANGLDANPAIMTKLARFDDPFAKRMIEALEVILDEEIDHVKKGDRWFRWACKKAGVEDVEEEYFKRVERVYPHMVQGRRSLNVEARRRAGFSCNEIRKLASGEVECR